MPAPTTPAELVELIHKSRLIDPARLDEFLAGRGSFAAPADLAHALTDAGLLTRFHTGQLLRGKHRGYFLGKYKLLERIGMGGMGQVFLAEHTSMKRRAAIKVLPPDMAANEYTKERFLREARAAGQLDHPNLVRAFDVDAENDVLFLVLEYIDGVSLHDLVARSGPLDPARAAYYLWQVANGLAYINGCGLVHRDIKPANLLVDRLGVVKILDLGLVRSQVEDDEFTRGQGVKILGTADFLAPEQAIDCSAVDSRADIYALGATGYFLLTGQNPYPAEKMAQKLIAHQVQPIPHARDVRPEVPAELDAVLVRMMAKKPADRPQTPEDVLALLEPWTRVPPPPPAEHELPAAPLLLSTSSAPAGQLVGVAGRPGSASGVHSAVSGQSAIRLHGDSSIRSGLRTPGSSGKLPPVGPTGSPLTPLPRPLSSRPTVPPPGAAATPLPVGQLAPLPAAVPPARDSLAPPVLPATHTHGLAGVPLPGDRPPSPVPAAFTRPVVPLTVATTPKSASRQTAKWVAAAVALALAAAAGAAAWQATAAPPAPPAAR